ncbi:cell division protein FtsK [Kineosporia sp. NBRC 101677]|uniref:FtsK/SpoIIIE domain-containing protein n=1 Tax=Kineosporia sp. NBRC 101677 TaxID=3032197 RepID=UPI0024A50E2D|nr:FtsK/SpoIIIE domain-containing protein [Kineosporia sp. NBRC 101677]GLY17667.1 cell division protein FtsK [Kineosporia sp. NBRC 101677]
MQLVISVATPAEDDPDQLAAGGASPVPGEAPLASRSWDVVLDVHKETPIGVLVGAAAGTGGAVVDNLAPAATGASAQAWSSYAEAGPAGQPYVDGRPVDPEATVAQIGLVSGQRIGLTAPTPPDDADWRPAEPGVDWLEIHAVGGPDAGRIWPIGFGTYDIGRAPGSWIRLDSDQTPLQGPELTVDQDGVVWLSGLGQTRLTQTGMTLADETATVRGGRLSLPEPPREEVGSPDPKYRRALEDAAIEYAALMEGHQGARRWPVGMDLAIGDTLLRLARRFDPDAALAPAEDRIGRDFNRPPRLVPPLMQPPVKMPTPPRPPQRRRIPLLMMLMPMVMGLAFVFFFKSYFFLLITLMTPLMLLGNWVADRRSGARQYREDSAEYRRRRMQAEKQVFASINEERLARCAASPDPALVGLIANGPSSRLWERRRTDPDFLVMRLGTVDQPSLMELDDPAREEPNRRYRWTVPDAPVGVSLIERGVVGVAGEPQDTGSIVRWMVAQAATLHSPRDLRLYLLLAPTGMGGPAGQPVERWNWARWLPQARPFAAGSGGPLVTVGNDPETIAHRVGELNQLIKARLEARGSQLGTVLFAEPDVLVVMDGARWLRDVPGVMNILVQGPAVRVFTIGVDALERLLPEECTAVVRADHDGLTLRQRDLPNVTGIRPDDVSPQWCEDVARSLSSLRDVTPDEIAGLPQQVNLLELLRAEPPTADLIAGLWARRPASTTFPLGKGFDGTVAFDLVRDGPHGLIAGTTGSGKSELLQSMVASLAAVNRPDELVFVLVDYKGGSAFHACVNLPHTLGMVTDLDEALALRALESLAAELRRREQMLADAGVKDLLEYRALRARSPRMAPMPRLLLVIDEFATMARETPSFVPGLVSIAQRGRSLGIHLILATQRPAGVVTSDIKANTNLRIALRVTDIGESQDVIDTHDAAHISARTPGRALARLGHRSTMPFQTAYVGSPIAGEEDESAAADKVLPPPQAERLTWGRLGRPVQLADRHDDPAADLSLPGDEAERTDLDALVEAIQEAARQAEVPVQPSPWLPALPPLLLLDDLDRLNREQGVPVFTRDGLTIASFAQADLPAHQRQQTLAFDPSTEGHLFVIGAPRAGRSQVLRTLAGSLARSNSSADVHMYAIDAAGSALSVLTDLPHCGGVVPRADTERLTRLITWLAGELERRHQLLAQHTVADLPELRVKLGREASQAAPAHIFLFVDGWDALATMLSEFDGGALYAVLQEILREGAGAGIHAIMTSERALSAGRVASLSDNKLMLRMTDRSDLGIIGVPANRLPTVIPPGRAWRTQDQVEVQVALLAADPSGQGQALALRAIGLDAAQRDQHLADSRRPRPVAALPSQAAFSDLFGRWPQAERQPLHALLGVGGGDPTPLTVDFSGRAHAFLVGGPSGSGRSNVLATLGISLLATGTKLIVITPRESPLRRLANHQSVHLLSGLRPNVEELRALVAPGGPGGSQTVLLIDDVDLLGPGHPLDPVLREVASVGRDRGLGIAFAGSGEVLTGPAGGWLGEAKRSRQGVLLAPQTSLEGDLLGIRLTHSQMRVPVRPGRGYTTLGAGQGKAQIIAIPHTTLK